MKDNNLAEIKSKAVFLYTADDITVSVNYTEIREYLKSFPCVKKVWDKTTVDLSDIKKIADKIIGANITGIIVAGDMPGFAKNVFTKAMALAGKNPNDVEIVSFKEIGANDASDTGRAKAALACTIYGVAFEQASEPDYTSVHPDTLVIGGGIAGIQASLEIADSGNKVYLVEKSGTIGGYMATFDKTFPTLDCAACILTPKMVEVGQHPNIELMTYCEVKSVSGSSGNYKITILKKARRVNLASCIGCGNCAEKCPAVVPGEFDSGTTMRKSIYIPFPQAVPNKYLIDADSCRYVKDKKCGVCVKTCPVPGCINLDEKDEEVIVTVGNIVVATGYKPFDAARIEQFGYGKFPNVLTSLEFERLVNASGSTGGFIKFRTQNKKGKWIFAPEAGEPKSIAIIHCVGSRDVHYNKYCSRVCCMYSLKLAHLVAEKLHNAEIFEYFIDMRAFGKGYEEFYNRIKHEGVKIIRGRTAKIEEISGQLMLRTEDILNARLIEQKVDMVILAVGLEPREDAEAVAAMLGIERSEDGWFREADSNSDTVGSFTGGITVAGVCQGPKDIPDTVAQASAAASKVIQSIIKGKIKRSLKDVAFEKIEENARTLACNE